MTGVRSRPEAAMTRNAGEATMERSRTLLPLLVVVLAGCDGAVTDPPPAASARGALVRPGTGYTVTSLPFSARAINDAGVIVGKLGTHAVRYNGAVIAFLPKHPDVTGDYVATAINRHGAIVGRAHVVHAAYWRTGDSVPTLIPSPIGHYIEPMAVNRYGVVVGKYRRADASIGAFKWTAAGGFQDITPEHCEYARAMDINDSGLIAGDCRIAGQSFAHRWQGGGTSYATLASGFATAIGSDGTAYGQGDTAGEFRAWLLSGGAVAIQSPSPDAAISDVSYAGRLVGSHRDQPLGAYRPWTRFGATLTVLPVPFGASIEPMTLRVNGCGSIVAEHNDPAHGILGLLWTKPVCDMSVEAPTAEY